MTAAEMHNQIAALIRQQQKRDAIITQLAREVQALRRGAAQAAGGDEFSFIAGRRVHFVLAGDVNFVGTTDDGNQGQPIALAVSQDGPFIWTHWPLIMWRPNLPTTATNFGQWRPVYHGPLPTQQVTTDFISISYTLEDTGAGRLLQSERIPPAQSRVDDLKPLPRPMMLEPNSTLIFTPFYEDINLNSGGTATTGGTLVVAFPGYKIITGGAAGVFVATMDSPRR